MNIRVNPCRSRMFDEIGQLYTMTWATPAICIILRVPKREVKDAKKKRA